MSALTDGGMKIAALYCAACILKQLLPGGSMRRSAKKAVDIVALIYLIKIVTGVLPNG